MNSERIGEEQRPVQLGIMEKTFHEMKYGKQEWQSDTTLTEVRRQWIA
jgi:hypothetical protein